MTFHDYLLKRLENTAMISLAVDGGEPFQYNYWNWFHQQSQFHLLTDDMRIGHILHNGFIQENEDGSVTFTSSLHPKKCSLNFYFGGAKY
jgi:hypothetical protein